MLNFCYFLYTAILLINAAALLLISAYKFELGGFTSEFVKILFPSL